MTIKGSSAKLIETEILLPKMEAFMRTMHHISLDLNIEPKKDHIATCIDYQDLNQLRNDFLREMLASVTRYVYSRNKQREIIEDTSKDREIEDAYSILEQRAKEKFRPFSIKGQFSELLLFNLLTFHFKAVPIVRKMKITTNPELERNGADAIHLRRSENKYILYLGEAKTYTSGFKKAFTEALSSIIDTHKSHRDELNLYKYEDFLDPDLRTVAEQYINNTLKDFEVHLVCIVTYCCGEMQVGENRDLTIKNYINSVVQETNKIKITDYSIIENALKARINYIFMPVNELEKLLTDFKTKLGV